MRSFRMPRSEYSLTGITTSPKEMVREAIGRGVVGIEMLFWRRFSLRPHVLVPRVRTFWRRGTPCVTRDAATQFWLARWLQELSLIPPQAPGIAPWPQRRHLKPADNATRAFAGDFLYPLRAPYLDIAKL